MWWIRTPASDSRAGARRRSWRGTGSRPTALQPPRPRWAAPGRPPCWGRTPAAWGGGGGARGGGGGGGAGRGGAREVQRRGGRGGGGGGGRGGRGGGGGAGGGGSAQCLAVSRGGLRARPDFPPGPRRSRGRETRGYRRRRHTSR